MRRLLASFVLAGSLVICLSAAPVFAVSAARRQLSTTLPEVRFDGAALVDAMDFLRDVSGANLTVNWKALEEAGITKDTPVNVRLHAVSLRKALEMVLQEVGGGDRLGYDLDQGVIQITTRELADSRMYTRIYPIQDLITTIPDFTDAPDFSLNSTSNNQNQNPQGGGQIGSPSVVFNPFDGASSPGQNKDPGKTKTQLAQELVELIRAVIQPDAWQEAGGKAAIRYWNGNLIVTAPRSIQEALGGAMD
ncbi:MAG TPA: hypothetical protein VFC78_13740 [Tepidisphaeraceae bacterium]|nr:hypothetical protein [Tepidisphaeraceae bacterium]